MFVQSLDGGFQRKPHQHCSHCSFPFGRAHDERATPFFHLLRLLFPIRADHFWANAGYRNDYDPHNLLVLEPSYHAMLDEGTIWLQPIISPEHTTMGFFLRFRYQPNMWEHTTLGLLGFEELYDGYHFTNGDMCGDGLLHRTIAQLRHLLRDCRFGRGRPEEQRDLAIFFE
jgi:hypothetical protein